MRHGLVAPRGLSLVDPSVIDRKLDKWRRGKRALSDCVGVYGVKFTTRAHEALADVVASIHLVRRLCQQFRELREISLLELQAWQADSFRDWRDGINAHWARTGKQDRVEGEWPLGPARVLAVGDADPGGGTRMSPRRCRHHCSHQARGICRDCRRQQHTAWARRVREKEQADRNRTAITCLVRSGRFGVCGGVLQDTTDSLGRLSTTCPRCERKRAGICRDCPRPVARRVGYALRCEACKAKATAASVASHVERNREEIRKRARLRRRRRIKKDRAWHRAPP